MSKFTYFIGGFFFSFVLILSGSKVIQPKLQAIQLNEIAAEFFHETGLVPRLNKHISPSLTQPFLPWTETFTMNGDEEYDYFGMSVALSGNTAMVGAPFGGDSGKGAVYVYTFNDLSLTFEQVLTADDGPGLNNFGDSVALDGNTALVGAPGDDETGAVYVFIRNGSNWVQQEKLVADDGTSLDRFGASVALHGDTALIGARGADIGANEDQGAAYVFIRNDTTWVQQGKLLAYDGAGFDYFGESVVLDDDSALIGAVGADVEENDQQGAAYLFNNNGTLWVQQQKFVADDGETDDYFGYSVALDEDTILIGAVNEHSYQGATYVFVRNGSSWSQADKLVANDGDSHDYFGGAVALEGDTAVIGAIGVNIDEDDRGAVYVFTRDGTNWKQQQKLLGSVRRLFKTSDPNGESPLDPTFGEYFGRSVALEGDILFVGASHADWYWLADQGRAYIFYPVVLDHSIWFPVIPNQ